MNKLFIYYSLTGNGDAVASILSSEGIKTIRIETATPLPKSKFPMLLVGGFKALINYKDKLVDFDNNIKDYDEILIGSPIWFDRLCSPINALLDMLELGNKKITFILYSGSGKASKAVKKITKMYSKNRIILLKEPKNNIEGNKELLLKELR